MSPLAHWNQSRLNQLNQIDDLQHRLRNLVRRSRASRSEGHVRAQWIPLVGVSEDARRYVIKAELPQVKKEDVRITLEAGRLIITGERKFDRNSRKDDPLALAYGRFAHNFVIPNDARPARVTSVFKDGVLVVHLTRNAKPATQQLNGKVSAAGSLGVGIEEAPRPFRIVPRLFSEIQDIDKNEPKMKTQLFENKDLSTGNRMTQFAFPAPTARQVSLAADFNNWDTKAGPMHKGPDGVWHLAVALKPGRYEYRFYADEVWCNDPAAQQLAKNSLGTQNSVRIV